MHHFPLFSNTPTINTSPINYPIKLQSFQIKVRRLLEQKIQTHSFLALFEKKQQFNLRLQNYPLLSSRTLFTLHFSSNAPPFNPNTLLNLAAAAELIKLATLLHKCLYNQYTIQQIKPFFFFQNYRRFSDFNKKNKQSLILLGDYLIANSVEIASNLNIPTLSFHFFDAVKQYTRKKIAPNSTLPQNTLLNANFHFFSSAQPQNFQIAINTLLKCFSPLYSLASLCDSQKNPDPSILLKQETILFCHFRQIMQTSEFSNSQKNLVLAFMKTFFALLAFPH